MSSDSDLDFLDLIPPLPKPSQPKPAARPTPQPSTPFNKDQLYEKIGENAILRSQLNKKETDHQRQVNELLKTQANIKLEYENQIRTLNQQIQQEKLKNRFTNEELRANASRKHNDHTSLLTNTTNAQPQETSTPVSSQHITTTSTSTSTSTSSKLSRPASMAFGDAFKLKKPRIQPLNDQLNATLKTQIQDPLVEPVQDLEHLFAFLVQHRTPGFNQTTLNLIGGSETSLGQQLSNVKSSAQFAELLVDHVCSSNGEANQSSQLGSELTVDTSTESKVPVLALLYDFLFLNLDLLGCDLPNCALRMCNVLIKWLKILKPFPDWSSMEVKSLALINIEDMWTLTAILYCLDVLLKLDCEFTVPIELARRLVSCVDAPNVVTMGLDLMSLHPTSEFTDLLAHQLKNVRKRPRIELLFSGVSEHSVITAIELITKRRYSINQCRLVERVQDLPAVQDFCLRRATNQFVNLQLSAVRLGYSMIYVSTKVEKIDKRILNLLTSNVESFIIDNNAVVKHAVLYFWCRDYFSLKDCLNEHELAELCVCLTKLMHGTEIRDSTIEQASQLLQLLSSGDEMDQLFNSFEIES